MNLIEKEISREYVFKGTVINVRSDTVITPSGNTATRDIVEHPGGVAIVVLTDDNKIILEKQYRRPYDEIVTEIPAGKRDKGEEPINCAIRELEEETGYKAKTFIPLGYIYPSPGFADEMLYLFLACDLKKGHTNPDEDEFIEIEYVSLEKAKELVMSGEIHDAKSCIGILKTAEIIRENKLDELRRVHNVCRN